VVGGVVGEQGPGLGVVARRGEQHQTQGGDPVLLHCWAGIALVVGAGLGVGGWDGVRRSQGLLDVRGRGELFGEGLCVFVDEGDDGRLVVSMSSALCSVRGSPAVSGLSRRVSRGRRVSSGMRFSAGS